MSANSSAPGETNKRVRPPPPPPHAVRVAARAVMSAFGTAVNKWGYLNKEKGWLLAFQVPKHTPVRPRHFAAVRAHHRAASAWVQWKDDHMRFVVKLPKRGQQGDTTATEPVADDGSGAIPPPARKRRRTQPHQASSR